MSFVIRSTNFGMFVNKLAIRSAADGICGRMALHGIVTLKKKFQKYLNKKSPITGYGLHSKFNLKDAAKCGRVGGVGERFIRCLG